MSLSNDVSGDCPFIERHRDCGLPKRDYCRDDRWLMQDYYEKEQEKNPQRTGGRK